jgi:hypothetical protein
MQDQKVNYNFGIHHIHRKHNYDHENITTTETILAANVQCIQNNVSTCFVNKRAHNHNILVTPNIRTLDQSII